MGFTIVHLSLTGSYLQGTSSMKHSQCALSEAACLSLGCLFVLWLRTQYAVVCMPAWFCDCCRKACTAPFCQIILGSWRATSNTEESASQL